MVCEECGYAVWRLLSSSLLCFPTFFWLFVSCTLFQTIIYISSNVFISSKGSPPYIREEKTNQLIMCILSVVQSFFDVRNIDIRGLLKFFFDKIILFISISLFVFSDIWVSRYLNCWSISNILSLILWYWCFSLLNLWS